MATFTLTPVATGAVVQAADMNAVKTNVADVLNNKQLSNENILTDHAYFTVSARFYFQAAAAPPVTRDIVLPSTTISPRYVGVSWTASTVTNRRLQIALVTAGTSLEDLNPPGATSDYAAAAVVVACGTDTVRVTWSATAGAFAIDEYCEVTLWFAAPIVQRP